MSGPIDSCEVQVENLGTLKGNVFEGNIRQFMGIPYGSISKRWTRATLVTEWKNNYHDGTVLGPCTPVPSFCGLDEGDILTPVYQFKHYKTPFITDEKRGLVANITVPPVRDDKIPVFVYIHGGSWMYGTSNLSIFDGVRLVSKSVAIGKPMIVVTFNYRCGISGFLASDAIEKELQEDGFSGSGNFGLTDQVLALEWINKNIHSFGGDSEEITICGESAGGCSVSNHIFSNINPNFKRAIAMSGLSGTIPAFSKEWHEKEYLRLLEYYNIENNENSLQMLRQIPEEDMAKATHLIQETSSATGNPCIDNWYLSKNINFTNFESPPKWLKGLVLGDTKDEAVFFFEQIADCTYKSLVLHFNRFVKESVREEIFGLYGISETISDSEVVEKFIQIISDFGFIIPNYQLALKSCETGTKVYQYHFDEPSTIDNELKGKSYHAIDLLYLFGNRLEDMTTSQVCLVNEFMARIINFVAGGNPWEDFSKKKAAICFGPQIDSLSCGKMVSIYDDSEVRSYSRYDCVKKISGSHLENFYLAIDYLINERKS